MSTMLESDFEALVLALKLAITAPDDAKCQQCLGLAQSLAANFSELDTERAKKRALEEMNKEVAL